MYLYITGAPESGAEIDAAVATVNRTIGSREDPFAALSLPVQASGLEWHEDFESSRDYLCAERDAWRELGYDRFVVLVPARRLASQRLRDLTRQLAFFLMPSASTASCLLECPVGVLSRQVTGFASWLDNECQQMLRDRPPRAMPPWEPLAPRLETERLVLTFATADQTEGYYQDITGTEMFDTLLWDGPERVQDLHDWILSSKQNYARGPDHPLSLAVIEKASDRQIGGVSWRPFQQDPLSGTVGYAIVPSRQGLGFGTEATRRLVEHLFSELLAERVEAEIFAGNERSRRVLEKCGFSRESTRRASIVKRGQRLDAWGFSITRADWLAANAPASEGDSLRDLV